jgi:hypothetical protein
MYAVPGVKRSLAVKAGISLIGAGVLGYAWWTRSPVAIADTVLHTFESGGRLGWDEGFKKDDTTAGVKRPDIEKRLEECFYPSPTGDLSASYVLITGAQGTGKSTSVRRVLRNRKGINGAVYVSVPPNLTEFGGVVSEAVGFSADSMGAVRAPALSEEPMATWSAAADSIQAAAIKFHEKHGRPAVLILDSVELIAKDNPAFLIKLQSFAKQWTDMGTLRVVLISSDGSVLKLLRSQSAWSRALKPPFEVGDIADADAVQFLMGKGVEENQAAEAVRDITGGRFALLSDYVAAYKAVGNKAAREELFKTIEKQLRGPVKLPRDHALFRALVENGAVDSNTADALAPEDAQKALLAGNILAGHYSHTKAYTFHSRFVQSFFTGVFGAKREEGAGQGGSADSGAAV